MFREEKSRSLRLFMVCLLLRMETGDCACPTQWTGRGGSSEESDAREAHASMAACIEFEGGATLCHANEALVHVRLPEELVQMQCAPAANPAIQKRLLVLYHLPFKNESLLLHENARRRPDLLFQAKDRVAGSRLHGDSTAREQSYSDGHR